MRSKANDVVVASSPTIQRKPSGLVSCDHRAGSARYASLRSRTSCGHAGVGRVVAQRPVEAALLAPLPVVGQLAAHEEQLLAGKRPHEREQRPHGGPLLPPVTGHLAASEPLPCTTSSWLIGRTKFSLQAYTAANVIWLWCHCRWTGSLPT